MEYIVHTSVLRIAGGYTLPHLDAVHTDCSICRQHTSRSVLAKSLIKSSTGDIADTFRSGERVCGDCAALFADSRLTGSIITLDGNLWRPMVALASATEERPAWRDLLRRITPGAETVAIVTSNTKRRLWPRAVLSTYGDHWRPLFVDGSIDRLLTINATRLLDTLELVEEVYAQGFSKPIIANSLYGGKSNLDFATLRSYETRLAVLRPTDEFILSLFIAQKEDA